MNQNHRDLRRAAMADFLQSLSDLESTFVEPLDDSLPPETPPLSPPTPSDPAPPPSESSANGSQQLTGHPFDSSEAEER